MYDMSNISTRSDVFTETDPPASREKKNWGPCQQGAAFFLADFRPSRWTGKTPDFSGSQGDKAIWNVSFQEPVISRISAQFHAEISP